MEVHLSKLKEKLVSRGYPVTLINEQFEKVERMDREDLLRPKTYPHGATPLPVVPAKPKFHPDFIFTYNPHNPPFKQWFIKYHTTLFARPLVDPRRKKILLSKG